MRQRCVVVTGASGGIGSAVCRELALAGFEVVATARRRGRLESVSSRATKAAPGRVVCETMDFGNAESIRSFAAWLKARRRAIDGIVLMPPQLSSTPDALQDREYWERVLTESFIGPMAFLREVHQLLMRAPRGKLLIVSGISSIQFLPHYATSGVIRAAWVAEAKALAFTMGPSVQVNTLSLGGVMTAKDTVRLKGLAKAAGITFQEFLADQMSNVPLRKYASPVAVATVVLCMLGRMTDHISGANLVCDGGFTRAY